VGQELDEPATTGTVSFDMIGTIGKRYVLLANFRGVAVGAGDMGVHVTHTVQLAILWGYFLVNWVSTISTASKLPNLIKV